MTKEELNVYERGIIIFSLARYSEGLDEDFEGKKVTKEELKLHKGYLNSIAKKLQLRVKYR